MKPKSISHEVVIKAVEARLKSRMDAHRINLLSKRGAIEEAAFLAGAMTVMHEVYGPSEGGNLSAACPPLWIIAPMTGRSVLLERARMAKGAA